MAPAQKKEKVFHPASRKAGQLARKALRKEKIATVSSKRREKNGSLADVYAFFFYALPESGALSLPDLHQLIRDVWLTRLDDEIAQEIAARRQGRPKTTKQQKLEDRKAVETELYRTGMEVIDLTHPENVALLRKWDQTQVAYIEMLRFIRIFSQEPERVVVTRPGKHKSLLESTKKADEAMVISQ